MAIGSIKCKDTSSEPRRLWVKSTFRPWNVERWKEPRQSQHIPWRCCVFVLCTPKFMSNSIIRCLSYHINSWNVAAWSCNDKIVLSSYEPIIAIVILISNIWWHIYSQSYLKFPTNPINKRYSILPSRNTTAVRYSTNRCNRRNLCIISQLRN